MRKYFKFTLYILFIKALLQRTFGSPFISLSPHPTQEIGKALLLSHPDLAQICDCRQDTLLVWDRNLKTCHYLLKEVAEMLIESSLWLYKTCGCLCRRVDSKRCR